MGRNPRQSKKRRGRKFFRVFLAFVVVGIFVAAIFLSFYYRSYSEMIDARLSGEVIHGESRLFTSPKLISIGQQMDPDRLAAYLEMSGYSTSDNAESAGLIARTDSAIEIKPSKNSYFNGVNGVRIEFEKKRISHLRSLDNGDPLISAEIEPELITGLFGRNREKRRPFRYEEIPPILIKAVLSAEDKRFFEHPGLDFVRIFGAAWHDIRRGEKAQGASTITMQVARSFFFSKKREWRRKFKEIGMAILLEHRFTKEQIFELYANEVYLGNRGSFAIHGFGEAAQAYFGKNLREISLGQAAFLAGIIRAPSNYASAERRPERAVESRDRVLAQMTANGVISQKEAQEAMEAPLNLVRGGFGASPSGHFVDMVRDDLLDRFSEEELIEQSYRIYTTLDSDLQRIAIDALEWGLQKVDAQLEKTYERWRKNGESVQLPQAALVAMDPHTGEIKALVGGRDYAQSQLNHALAKRQPGSVFKPFVYAAAFETALDGENISGQVFTPLTTMVDEPTVFFFDGREYTPNNYGQDFHGVVTLREALRRSLNIVTVKLAEDVGYKRIVSFTKRLGLNSDIKPTPAIALGAYEMSPLEVAKGYTAFANYGLRCEPELLKDVVSRSGEVLQNNNPRRRSVLDPRVAYLVTNLMEDVMNHGTGAGVRSRGFSAPAAGKTGTSRDGWFAGYTSNLLCVVWVGFDDNRELKLTGASSAGYIWGEFMKQAVQLPGFSGTQRFERPEGVVSVSIDADTFMPANESCPNVREEIFIAGSEPVEYCTLHGNIDY